MQAALEVRVVSVPVSLMEKGAIGGVANGGGPDSDRVVLSALSDVADTVALEGTDRTCGPEVLVTVGCVMACWSEAPAPKLLRPCSGVSEDATGRACSGVVEAGAYHVDVEVTFE